MSTDERDGALAVVKSTSVPIHDIGTAIYLGPDVFGWAADGAGRTHSPSTSPDEGACWAMSARRCLLGHGVVRARRRQVDVRRGRCRGRCDRRGPANRRSHRPVGTEVSGRRGRTRRHRRPDRSRRGRARGFRAPLFVGWRAAPKAKGSAGRAAQLMQILREWRGGVHLVATTAAGLSPVEAILTNEGEGQANSWAGPTPSRTTRPTAQSTNRPRI